MTVLASSPDASAREYVPVPAQGEGAKVIQLAEWRAREAVRRVVAPPFDLLEAPLAYAVAERWREPCEAAFEFIVERRPEQLAELIVSGALGPADLTFAAEILGRCSDGPLVRQVLVPLLHAQEAVVREGAIYGLSPHLDTATVQELRRAAAQDPSAAVRSAVQDALEQ